MLGKKTKNTDIELRDQDFELSDQEIEVICFSVNYGVKKNHQQDILNFKIKDCIENGTAKSDKQKEAKRKAKDTIVVVAYQEKPRSETLLLDKNGRSHYLVHKKDFFTYTEGASFCGHHIYAKNPKNLHYLDSGVVKDRENNIQGNKGFTWCCIEYNGAKLFFANIHADSYKSEQSILKLNAEARKLALLHGADQIFITGDFNTRFEIEKREVFHPLEEKRRTKEYLNRMAGGKEQVTAHLPPNIEGNPDTISKSSMLAKGWNALKSYALTYFGKDANKKRIMPQYFSGLTEKNRSQLLLSGKISKNKNRDFKKSIKPKFILDKKRSKKVPKNKFEILRFGTLDFTTSYDTGGKNTKIVYPRSCATRYLHRQSDHLQYLFQCTLQINDAYVPNKKIADLYYQFYNELSEEERENQYNDVYDYIATELGGKDKSIVRKVKMIEGAMAKAATNRANAIIDKLSNSLRPSKFFNEDDVDALKKELTQLKVESGKIFFSNDSNKQKEFIDKLRAIDALSDEIDVNEVKLPDSSHKRFQDMEYNKMMSIVSLCNTYNTNKKGIDKISDYLSLRELGSNHTGSVLGSNKTVKVEAAKIIKQLLSKDKPKAALQPQAKKKSEDKSKVIHFSIWHKWAIRSGELSKCIKSMSNEEQKAIENYIANPFSVLLS